VRCQCSVSEIVNAGFIHCESTFNISFSFVYSSVCSGVNDKRRCLFSYYLLNLLNIGNIQLAGAVTHNLTTGRGQHNQSTANLPGYTRNSYLTPVSLLTPGSVGLFPKAARR